MSRYEKIRNDIDIFFEKDPEIIEKYYMPVERNTKPVSLLIQEFFYFMCYEHNPERHCFDITCQQGIIRNPIPNPRKPFTVQDPFEFRDVCQVSYRGHQFS